MSARSRWRRPDRRARRAITVLAPVGTTAAATGVIGGFGIEPASAGLLLLLVVAANALIGRVAGVLAAALAAIAYNYAALPPTGAFGLDKTSDLVAFVVFTVVALLIGTLISRESELREEVDSTTAKAAYFAAVGHNLRTPLTTVTTAVDTLLTVDDELTPHQRRELLESIRDETHRLSLLVTRSLELAKFRDAGLAPRPSDVDVLGLVQAALARLGPGVANRCRYTAADGVPLAHVDIAMTEEILTVLLENAARYSGTDEPIEVDVIAVGPWIDVRVIDHGPGVPVDDRERIFAEYERGRHTGEVPGSGLGLAVGRALAEAQRGQLRMEPTDGGGATFVVRLPGTAEVSGDGPHLDHR